MPVREITCLIESSDLIVRHSVVIELLIELPCVETEGPACDLGMTTQTFVAAGIVPNLGVSFALLLNVNVFVQPLSGYESGVGLRVIPAIGYPIDSLGISAEKTSFNAARGIWVSNY